MDKRSLLIKTQLENNYLVATAVSQIILLHPILKEIIEYERDKGDFSSLLTQAEQNNDPAILPVSQVLFSTMEEVKYYYRYFLFLKENKFFDPFSLHKLTNSRYTASDIQHFVAGTSHISFEVTDRCNLECVYCCYGELYTGFDNRTDKDTTFDTARKIIDHWWKERRNRSVIPTVDQVNFGFYGGEPLLNFPLIQQVVAYVKEKLPSSVQIGFSMTSNGILLDKYMQFLAENNFLLMISLDGDFEHNKYRVNKDGSYSFHTICRNVELLRKKYPDYYDKNVEFNTILHDRNNRRKVMDFFLKRFGKTPHLSPLSKMDVREEKRTVFENMRRVQPDDSPTDEAAPNSNTSGKQEPLITDVFDVRGVVFSQTRYIVRKYAQLLENLPRKVIVSTGTCAPFSKKIFITVNGKILPCERVPQYFSMGTVDETAVHLDYEGIAKKYNDWYAKMGNTCNNCHDCHYCSQCIFYLNLNDDCVSCDRFKSKADYAKKLARTISKIETTPATYLNVFPGTGTSDHGDCSMVNTGSRENRYPYLYLHPYVHLNVKTNHAVVYNTLNSSVMEFSRQAHPEIFAVLKQLDRGENLYVIALEDEKISPELEPFIESLRRSFSGDVSAGNLSKGKPIQFKPMLKLEDPTDSEQLFSVKSKIKILPGDNIGEYLNTFNLYINEACTLDCDFCSTAYRQFLCCHRTGIKGNEKSIPVSHVTSLCDQLKETNLINLNILGGNILQHKDLALIVKSLNKAPFKKNWYIHWRNLAQVDKLPAALGEGENLLHLICHAPVEKKVFKTALDVILKSRLPAVFHFVLASEEDLNSAEAMVEEFGIEDVELHPYYVNGGGNLNFFEDNIFINREIINESGLNMQDIFARGTLNTLNFKQLTMMCDGRVYANVNHPSPGKFPENSLPGLIKKELMQGASWGRIRKNLTPCKSCPYNALCPPVSNYEYSLKRYNLCDIIL